ncbi:MAG: adenylyl-sulfate kinase, partial [Candidatus Limnocylindrales bacterium]
MSEGNVQGVLLTGIFGVGKSTVAAEMAEMLEERQVRYAALDMDWLTWAYSADHD